MKWDKPADDNAIERSAKSLEKNGIKVVVAESKKDAFQKAFELIPKGAEVMDMTSVTLDAIGISKEVQESGKYQSVRKKIMAAGKDKGMDAFRTMSAAVDYAIGSVHAVTEDGKVVVASASGSQLGPYAYGAKKLIWVVGTQKIVKNIDEALKRIQSYTFPLEDQRAVKVYGMHSGVNKVLIVEKEMAPERITVIFVKEALGF